MSRVTAALAFLLFTCGVAAPLRAQDAGSYDVEADDSVWLRALLDVRIADGGSAVSWTDHGPGKLRYGARSDAGGARRETQFVLSQLAVQMGASLPWGIRAQAQVNLQPDLDSDPRLIEAFLRREWSTPSTGQSLQLGLMTNPFSLEHTGPAWSPAYSLSASALNSWLWEEISVAGVEGEWWHETRVARLGVMVGAGYGPDRLARGLALRGWVMGDHLVGLNSELPMPNGTRMDIFDERDHRPAAYTSITLADPAERGQLKLGYLDNGGDLDVAGVWRTRLATVGAVVHPVPSLDVVVQYLRGKARVHDSRNDSSLRAFYALVSNRYKAHRFTVRYDEFKVDDLDGGPSSTRERGDAMTAAYAFEHGLRHSIGLEYLWLTAHRARNARPHLSQDGWQISYRFRY